MHLPIYASLSLVFLFALALSGLLWIAFTSPTITPRVVLSFLALVALVAVDFTLLVNS